MPPCVRGREQFSSFFIFAPRICVIKIKCFLAFSIIISIFVVFVIHAPVAADESNCRCDSTYPVQNPWNLALPFSVVYTSDTVTSVVVVGYNESENT